MIGEKDPEKLILKAAEKLKEAKEIQVPEWGLYVKTGVSRQRPPMDKDWWLIRTAAVLRKVYLKPRGVSELRKLYGGRKNRGHKPEHKRNASGSIIREILQQLEAKGYVKQVKGKGRVITPKGQSFIDNALREV